MNKGILLIGAAAVAGLFLFSKKAEAGNDDELFTVKTVEGVDYLTVYDTAQAETAYLLVNEDSTSSHYNELEWIWESELDFWLNGDWTVAPASRWEEGKADWLD